MAEYNFTIKECIKPKKVRKIEPQDCEIVTDGVMRDAETMTEFYKIPVFREEDRWLHVRCADSHIWFLDVTIMRIGMDGKVYEYKN